MTTLYCQVNKLNIMDKLKPLADRVLVIQDEAQAVTESGLLIPDTAKEKPNRGKVLDIGEKVTNISIGDYVLYSKYGGTQVTSELKDCVLLKQSDILAIL